MSYKGEVIADSSGKWTGNGLTFPTHLDAEQYARDLRGGGRRQSSTGSSRAGAGHRRCLRPGPADRHLNLDAEAA